MNLIKEKSCADRALGNKTRRAVSFLEEMKQKAGHFACAWFTAFGFRFWMRPTTGVWIQFPEGRILESLLKLPESTRINNFGFDSLYGWGDTLWSELPWSQGGKIMSIDYARRPLSRLSEPLFRSEIIKKWSVLARRFTKQDLPKSCLLLGSFITFPSFKEKLSPVNSAIAFWKPWKC